MAKEKLTLWLLNRVVEWDHRPLLEALGKNYDVCLGRRVLAEQPEGTADGVVRLAVNDPAGNEEGRPGELMLELKGTRYDEYFVPIPSKCVGAWDGPFWRQQVSPEGAAHLERLGAYLRARFPGTLLPSFAPGPSPLKNPAGSNFGLVQLNVAERGLGYYEMLQRATRLTGAQNVLVGYSQGGTVARYLAYLDEQVSKQPCIHGVVTVQAPNRGSPVASAAKREEVSQALLAIALALPRWLPGDRKQSKAWSYLRPNPGEGVIEFLNGLLDELVEDWSKAKARPKLIDRWITARKWLSGLSGVRELAFWDLDPLELARPGSVLDSINRYPLQRVWHGAVIGTDNRLPSFAQQLAWARSFWVGLLSWVFARPLKWLLDEPSRIYREDAMSFPRGTDAALVRQYQQGLRAGELGLSAGIEAYAHDFVIPSVSQLLMPGTGKAHLGNLVNGQASHVSGADGGPNSEGTTDVQGVVALLEKMEGDSCRP